MGNSFDKKHSNHFDHYKNKIAAHDNNNRPRLIEILDEGKSIDSSLNSKVNHKNIGTN